MTRKKKILFVTKSHKLASGFGTYAKEILQRIYDTGKYEIAQLAIALQQRLKILIG